MFDDASSGDGTISLTASPTSEVSEAALDDLAARVCLTGRV
jgi:hypothetical protein